LRGGVDNGALAVITVNASTPENTDKVIVLATHKGSASFTMRPLHDNGDGNGFSCDTDYIINFSANF
jgi:hypothetical protein